MSFAARVNCYSCSGRAQTGTAALLAYLMDRFPRTGSYGIYNCRKIAGSSTRSQHSCGRAGDSKCPTIGGRANKEVGNPVVQFLAKYASQLGIVEIIYNRVIYDRDSPKGRRYGGVHPHYDHVHWAQNSTKARSLTYRQIVAIAGPAAGGPQPRPPAPRPPSGGIKLTITRTQIKKGSKTALGGDVALAQGLLHAWGYGGVVGKVDGNFGQNTHDATVSFQKAKKLSPDGIIGETTWKALES